MFPSLTPQAATTGDLGAGMLARRNTVNIEVNGVVYEVGPDAELAQGGMARNRNLLTDYCRSDAYMALLRGALHYMNVLSIDLLSLGLPVSTYGQYKNELMERAVGIHDCAGRKVHVKNVRVYPQPLGGFFDYAVRSRLFSKMNDETNLMIDPGFFTLDWLVTRGLKTIDARSGAANDGGMGSLLKGIAKALAKDLDVDESEIGEVARIDAALRGVIPFKLFGKEIDISKYKAIGVAKAGESINQLMHTVGRSGDIGNIVLVGGGSYFYEQPLRDRFPRHEIAVAHDPVFANARGFHLIGEQRVNAVLAVSGGREAA
jgi:plasmid segregation protein ParM